MAYLLDTCLVSEPKQKTPNPGAISFLAKLRPMDTFVSSITLAEVWKGIELLSPSQRRTDLENWFENDLRQQFGRHVLFVDLTVARQWGTLVAARIRAGRTMPELDSLIAATALAYDLTIVTRDVKGFASSGARILNPWT